MDLLAFVKFAYVFYLSYQFHWLSALSEQGKNSKKCSFPAIFNFGDSNSDEGIRDKYCDGRLIIDFMASDLNVPLLKPYFNNNTNYTTGASFAVGGATTVPYLKETNLDQEYQNFVHLISNKGGMSKENISQALYTIDAGQNDVGYRLKNFTSIEEINAMVPKFVDAIVVHIKALYAKGARYFWIHNTGPIGCLPNLHRSDEPLPLSDQKDEVGCIVPYNKVCQYFNKKLKESVVSLRISLPSATFTYVDIYSIKYTLFTQRKKYGFSPPDYSYHNSGCGGSENQDACKTSILFDSIHYTDAADKIIYDLILTGKFSDPSVTPNLTCNQ